MMMMMLCQFAGAHCHSDLSLIRSSCCSFDSIVALQAFCRLLIVFSTRRELETFSLSFGSIYQNEDSVRRLRACLEAKYEVLKRCRFLEVVYPLLH